MHEPTPRGLCSDHGTHPPRPFLLREEGAAGSESNKSPALSVKLPDPRIRCAGERPTGDPAAAGLSAGGPSTFVSEDLFSNVGLSTPTLGHFCPHSSYVTPIHLKGMWTRKPLGRGNAGPGQQTTAGAGPPENSLIFRGSRTDERSCGATSILSGGIARDSK